MEDGEIGRNRVQDVYQKFQILEDHTVARELQEEEIHQHLSTNRLKNQRVRHNLRVARRLQEEEIERSRQLSKKLRKHVADCGDESAGSDHTRTIQEDGDWEEDKKDRQRASREADRRLRKCVREMGRYRDVGSMDSVLSLGDKVSPARWDVAVQQESPRYGHPRSRRPFVWRETEEGAGRAEGRGDGSRDAGSELGLGDFPPQIPGLRGDRGSVESRPSLGKDPPHASPTRSKPQRQRLRTRSSGTRDTVSGGRERGHPLRERRSDRGHTEGSEQPGSTLSIPRRSPRSWDGERSRSPGGSHPVWQSASDPESHSRRWKHKRNAADLCPRARSEIGRRPVRLRQNGDSRSGNVQEKVRHRHGIQEDPSSTGDPQRDRRGRLDIQQRANHLRDPADPKERPKQAMRLDAEKGHHPLAGEDKKKQAPHPLIVAQPHQPLAVSQMRAPHPLVEGEKPVHQPLPTKVKAKQVHFLLDDGEKVKPAHWSMTSKHKQEQRLLDGKGKEIFRPMAGWQTQTHIPLAAEEKGKHIQIPLAVKGKDVQSPLVGKERKNPSRFPLAAKRNPIQYQLDDKDTDTIIDYLLDKRKGGSSPLKRPGESASPPFKGTRSTGMDAGKPLDAPSTNRKLLVSLLPGDSQDGHTSPPRPGTEKDPGSDRSKASGGPSRREEPTPRAAGGAERKIPRKLPNGARGESDRIRDHQDTATNRPGKNRVDCNGSPSPRNQRGNRACTGEQRIPEDKRKFPADKSGNLTNGISVPAWLSDETLKELQAIELRKARLQKARRDEKRAQVVQDEEFALQLLRNEMMALQMDEGQKLPAQSQKAARSPERENDEDHRSSSPCSVNVDWDEAANIEKPVYF